MLNDYDRDTGCCGCLGFLRKRDRGIDSLLENHFARLADDLDGVDGYRSEQQVKVTGLPRKDAVICREKPVKETTHLRRSEVADGCKMINEYVRQCNIGRGSYGKVVLYHSQNDGKPYAIKAFYKSHLSRVRVTSSETAMNDVRREVSIMKMLEHPNIVNLVEVIDDPRSDRFYMVLEYVDGKWICDPSGTPGGIGVVTARRYLRDITAGLMYLHDHGIVHGDIKPENLLVTKSGAVKICDFGISHAFEDGNDERVRSPGTPVFTAPECCLGQSYHGKAADVWALGVTLYCMVLGYCPFIGDCLQDTYDKIVNTPLYIPDEIDSELKDLLQGLLCKDPTQRMTLDAIAEHPWVVKDEGPIKRTLCKCKYGSSQKDKSMGDSIASYGS